MRLLVDDVFGFRKCAPTDCGNVQESVLSSNGEVKKVLRDLDLFVGLYFAEKLSCQCKDSFAKYVG